MPAAVHDPEGSNFGAKGILYAAALLGCILSTFAALTKLEDRHWELLPSASYLVLAAFYWTLLLSAERIARMENRRRRIAGTAVVAVAITWLAAGLAGVVFLGAPALLLLVVAALPSAFWPKPPPASPEPTVDEEPPPERRVIGG